MKTNAKYARVISVGNRQAVLLPSDVRFTGKRVSVLESGRGLLISPVRKPLFRNTKEWLAAIKAHPMSPDFLKDRD
ncbi:MAG: hypothetical protein WBW69_11150 [Candidatus Korobacteraceae bacterium]